MKVLFIGQNGLFTMIPLQTVANEHDIVGIVESAPRNYNRNKGLKQNIKDRVIASYRKIKSTPTLEKFAIKASVPYFLLTKENQHDLVQFISSVSPDIICVASMSQLLKKEAYSLPRYGTINFHPALLPHYRGPNPWVWEYYYMEKEVGVTIHYIDDGEDTGDILKQGKVDVHLGMPPDKLMNSVIQLGARLMLETLNEIGNGTAVAVPQRHIECSHRARNVDKNEQLVKWNDWSIERVWHFLRGTFPWLNSIKSEIPGLKWTVKNYSKCSTKGLISGKKYLSIRGWYICHPEGKIYIKPHWSIKSFIKDIFFS